MSDIFSENGVKTLLAIRDNAKRLLEEAGAFKAIKAWKGISGDTFTFHACLDYMVAQEELYVLKETKTWAGQDEIYTAGKKKL